MSGETQFCEVAVIGAGLAGTVAASVLRRSGRDVVLIDTNAVYPYEFRAEKLGQAQMDLFERLGLGAAVRDVTTPTDETRVVRFGRLSERERKREYGTGYADLINGLRDALPAGLAITLGRVAEIANAPERSVVSLTDGRRIEARLVLIATGLGELVRRKVGIERDLISERHSLSIGFDLAAPLSAYPFQALTYYGEGFGTRTAYLTLFPIGPVMRANLFVYREPNEAWTRAFRLAPQAELAKLLPGLTRLCPDMRVEGRVEIRPIDLARAADPARDGVVLVGDACQTTCPIPGTGIGKVLTDVDRLCLAYVPLWLAGRRIDCESVAAFYADPVKRASDEASLRASLYARAIATQNGPAWVARRGRNFVGRHVLHAVHEAKAVMSRLRGAPVRVRLG